MLNWLSGRGKKHRRRPEDSSCDQDVRREGFRIRQYRPADRNEILDITVESFPGVCLDENIEKAFGEICRPWTQHKKDSVDCDLLRNPSLTLVAEAEGRIVGFACSRIYPDRSVGHIANLAVKRDFRGRGIGRTLLEKSMDMFRRQGLNYAKIETLQQNETGRHFYPSLGFREVGRQIFYFKQL